MGNIWKGAVQKILCVFPVCIKDIHLLLSLLQFIKELGGCKKHNALIVADAGLAWKTCVQAIALAEESFSKVHFYTNGLESVEGWVKGANSLWIAAAKYCYENKIEPWLFIEPDAVPLKASWLHDLDFDYKAGSITACLYPHHETGRQMISGIACYPANIIELLGGGEVQLAKAFDVALSENFKVMEKAVHTPLIQHVWGEDGLPPTFQEVRTETSPRNTFTLDNLNPQAVIFHRSKNGSLLRLLRLKYGFIKPLQTNPLLLVLPVCNKDADIMLDNINWMAELDGRQDFQCLISYEHSLDRQWLSQLEAAANRAFTKVHLFGYMTAPATNWPAGPNWAFQNTARYVQSTLKMPWFWSEADAVPIKSGWLKEIQNEYLSCGRPIMGNIVPGMGHMNGAGIYPPDFPTLSPLAMSATDTAWDYYMKDDMIHLVHDSSRIMCHVWGMIDGEFHPSAGAAPHFAHAEIVKKLIKPEWVWAHRVKDKSLVARLREMRSVK